VDVQIGVAYVHRTEHPTEVVPERTRVVWVVIREGALDGLGREEAAILAKGDEENPVQELLRGSQDQAGLDVRIDPAQSREGAPSSEGVLRVKLDRQIASDLL
jgi:hypothetical protein